MDFQAYGQPGNPVLLCVPGLMGGAEDFQVMLPEWQKRFHVLVLDPNAAQRKAGGISGLTEEVMKEISYESTAQDVAATLDRVGAPGAYLVGISLGGKIVYDFAAKFPQRFLGGLITDVGPGPFGESDLFRFVDNLVEQTPMHLPWPEMKENLKQRIPDRNLRSLIQTQISYPERKPPAVWKTAMKNFGSMLERQEIDEQFEGLEKVDAELAAKQTFFKVLHAVAYSGISQASLPRIQKLRSVKLISVEASHFLHVSHKDLVVNEVLAMLDDSLI